MKVIILNGSPKAEGNTATALHEVERTLNQQGINRMDTRWASSDTWLYSL
jgi:multimeric flavodoxin WrbA